MFDWIVNSGTLLALAVFIISSVWLATLAQCAVRKGSFLRGYFLGNRGLGAWALALTATVQSGGTFMGFPSMVYSFGWSVALWIAGYMIVPLSSFAILAKRMAQLSRRTNAITVPDMFRERFGSPAAGLVASLLTMLFMTLMMSAQFKAGALVLKVAWMGKGSFADPSEISVPVEKSAPAATPEVGAANDGQKKHEAPKITVAIDRYYYIGLAAFTLVVLGYTLIGGFLAAVWTDLFQSIMMLVGVLILLPLCLSQAGGLEQATLTAIANTDSSYAFAPGYSHKGRDFMPLGLALSYFSIWVFAGIGSPASLVRVMASNSTATIRRSIVLLGFYNSLIYIPLVIICICGRAIFPDLDKFGASDEIIPRLAVQTTSQLPGGSLWAGLILAAPFGAVMATVSTLLVVIASGVVRDVYQKLINPSASEAALRNMSYIGMIVVGAIAVGVNINPQEHLQVLVVFSGSGGAATFVVPAVMACYWRRATAAGCMGAMFSGAGVMIGLLVIGIASADQMIGPGGKFRPYYLLDCEPVVWGLLSSAVVGVVVSLLTKPPPQEVVDRLFNAPPPTSPEIA